MIGIFALFKDRKQKEKVLKELQKDFECEVEKQDEKSFSINIYTADSYYLMDNIAKYFENIDIEEGYADLYYHAESRTLHKTTTNLNEKFPKI